MAQINNTIPLKVVTRQPSGRRWRAHAPDYDEEVARVHLFKPSLSPTHTDKRRVAIYYTCEKLALFKFFNWMDKKKRENSLQEKHAFYFATGCCVFWGLTREEEARHLMMLTPFSSGMMDQVDAQVMEFSYGDRSSIARDAIILCMISVAEKMALSFAMSQSATLSAFETRVEDRIRSTKHIPSRLASVGSIQYSQEDMSKLIGQLFIELADVNIHSNILDEPEYFLKSQDNDDFKYLYERMLKYQDVANRVAILNKRLSIIRDLVGVLNQQLTQHQGSKLEWIIIWMLVFQVVIAIGWEIILKDVLGYFHWG
ncbi:unnamed protein product [Peronospora farinosa]|uniref:DUF155 domain-containing protein n=1 Tax=Peronospora farinosa TaxID=134698 RepID=A0AAV0UI82_9STRA|nr:unnamed protein product [Peronospora farinosa]